MKLAIIGSRTISELDIAAYIPEGVTEVITGGAKGVDTLAEAYADKMKWSKYVIRPDYQRYGKGAPILRNQWIVDCSDAVLVFWDGSSKGTKSTIAYAEKREKPCSVIQIAQEEKG